MVRSAVLTVALVSVLFFACAGGAAAAERSGRLILSPFIGGYLFEGNQDLRHGPVYGFGLGYGFDETWSAEAGFGLIDTRSDSGKGDVDGYLYRIDAQFHFRATETFQPYAALGVGAITLDPDRGGSRTRPLINYAGGAEYFFTDFLSARAELRHVISFDKMYNNLMYTAGVSIYFDASGR